MASTPLYPLHISYYDNPIDNLEFLKTLEDKEAELYTLGYVQACYQVMEALGDSKRRFLTAALATDEDDPLKSRLMSFVKLLDSLDLSLENRVDYLKRSIIDDEE